MANELQRLLELACLEPGYGPAFYRCLLASDVYGIVPAPGHGKDDCIVRFVMWPDADGSQIIPYFSERAKVRRALTRETVSLRINGRTLMEATRGATLVLNPNEPNTCRLAPGEITALLETGAISDPEWVQLTEQRMFAFEDCLDRFSRISARRLSTVSLRH